MTRTYYPTLQGVSRRDHPYCRLFAPFWDEKDSRKEMRRGIRPFLLPASPVHRNPRTGALMVKQASVVMESAILVGNEAVQTSGGAIYVGEEAEVNLTAVTFSSNRAGEWGGAVASELSGDVFMAACSFDGNMAVYGGALFISPPLDAIVRIGDSTFDENFAGTNFPAPPSPTFE